MSSEFWEYLIYHPPVWFLAVLVTGLGAFVISTAVHIVVKQGSLPLIVILELVVVLVLISLTLHSYYEVFVGEKSQRQWHDQPFTLLCSLMLFTIFSMIVYLVLKVLEGVGVIESKDLKREAPKKG